MSYQPHKSGHLTGGGRRGAKPRRNVVRGNRLRHFPDVHITDSTRVKQVVSDFDPRCEWEYTKRELVLLAEKILLVDPKPFNEHPYWLSCSQLRERQRREVYTANGIPDPSYVSGLYWRTHPEGRSVRSDEQRKKNGSAYYR